MLIKNAKEKRQLKLNPLQLPPPPPPPPPTHQTSKYQKHGIINLYNNVGWDARIENVSKTLSRNIFLLNKLRRVLSPYYCKVFLTHILTVILILHLLYRTIVVKPSCRK